MELVRSGIEGLLVACLVVGVDDGRSVGVIVGADDGSPVIGVIGCVGTSVGVIVGNWLGRSVGTCVTLFSPLSILFR
jgi:hypothetical protein